MLRLGRFGGDQKRSGRNDLGPIRGQRQLPKLSPILKNRMEAHITSGIHSLERSEDCGPKHPAVDAFHRGHKKPSIAARHLRNGHKEYTTPHCPQGAHHKHHGGPNMAVTTMAVARRSV